MQNIFQKETTPRRKRENPVGILGTGIGRKVPTVWRNRRLLRTLLLSCAYPKIATNSKQKRRSGENNHACYRLWGGETITLSDDKHKIMKKKKRSNITSIKQIAKNRILSFAQQPVGNSTVHPRARVLTGSNFQFSHCFPDYTYT